MVNTLYKSKAAVVIETAKEELSINQNKTKFMTASKRDREQIKDSHSFDHTWVPS